MLVLCKPVTIALLAASAAAIPFSPSCATRYPLAKHIIPLYRSYFPATGNFEADITVGSQTVRAVMDTGSSDIFFMPQDVQCLDVDTLQPIPDEQCGYKGPKLTPSPSFQLIPNTHSNISYATGEELIAVNGYNHIPFGGIDVPKQEIGLAKTAAVSYAGNATGLVGLAYPSLIDLYPGNNASTDVKCNDFLGPHKAGCNQESSSPLLSTIFADGLTPPMFSFALNRGTSTGGIMAVGGIPDPKDPRVNVTHDSVEVTVPIEKLEGAEKLGFFTLSVDGFHYAGAPPEAGRGQYVADTGTVPTIIDKDNAERFNALFDPPAWYNETLGVYIVQCNATVPSLAVDIAGQTFHYNTKDLIQSAGEDDLGCLSGVQGSTTAGNEPPILGSVFLRSVLAVFDVGKTQMTFASRLHYQE